MKKSTLFGFLTGAFGATLASKYGYGSSNFEWWAIVIGTIIFLNVLYDFCKNDEK